MLTYELMGWVALWIIWGNTALIAAVALGHARRLRRRAATMSPAGAPKAGVRGLFRGKLTLSDEAARVELRVSQVGRSGAGAGRSIVFHDRAHRSQVAGRVVVETESGEHLVVPPDQASAEVWLEPGAVGRAAECPSESTFKGAHAASRARGFERDVVAAITSGSDVFVAGRVEERDGELVIVADTDGPVVVATVDPHAFCTRKAAFAALVFVPAILAGAAIVTALALTPPVFEGFVSKLGGALGLAFFLLVLPAGTALRDAVLDPSRRFVRGKWVDPTERATAAEARP